MITDHDIERIYECGQYQILTRLIRESTQISVKAQIYLLAIGDYQDVQHLDEIEQYITDGNPLGQILQALSHIDISPYNNLLKFPEILGQDFVKSYSLGLEILRSLNTRHSNYLLSRFELNVGRHDSGHQALIASAQQGHLQAQEQLQELGVNWINTDQCCDHIDIWVGCPDCTHLSNFGDRFRSCVGCGHSKSRSGWIASNCLICGCQTELNCAQCAQYSTNGFIDLLRIIDHPVRLCVAILTALILSFQSLGTSNQTYADWALYLTYILTVLTTLSAFIKQETIRT